MGVSGRILISLLAVGGVVSAFAPAAIAIPRRITVSDELPLNRPTVPEALEEIDGTNRYYFDDTLGGNAVFTFGVPSYKDRDITKITSRVEEFYRDQLRQQTQVSPEVRTRDLANPFCTSLLGTTPSCNLAAEPLPPAPAPVLPPAPPPPAAPFPVLY
jgi:hypothetical protein